MGARHCRSGKTSASSSYQPWAISELLVAEAVWLCGLLGSRYAGIHNAHAICITSPHKATLHIELPVWLTVGRWPTDAMLAEGTGPCVTAALVGSTGPCVTAGGALRPLCDRWWGAQAPV